MGINNGSRFIADIDSLRRLLVAVPRGVGLVHLTALTVVAVEPGLSVNELADRLGVPQQNASRYAAQLLGRYQDDDGPEPVALIEQGVNNADPRKRALHLSVEGQKFLERLLKEAASAQQ